MKFKLIVVLVDDRHTETVVRTAREAGATGSTVVASARGTGLRPVKTFLDLEFEGQRDVILLLVEEHLSRHILENIGDVCRFDEKPGSGIAFQVDIEDVVGLASQLETISSEIEGMI